MKKTTSVLLLSSFCSVVAADDKVVLPSYAVQSSSAFSEFSLNPEQERPAAYGADLLRHIPGVSVGRFGGHGLEPTVRGQNQGRLNIVLDGAYVHGGCPNRMDPPASFAALDSYQSITVLKGVQSLEYGGGGSGGTVLFERQNEVGEGDEFLLSGGASDNGLDHEFALDARTGGDAYFLRATLSQKKASNYQDGNGDEVRSAFATQGVNLLAGFALDAQQRLELGLENTQTDDALFAGAGMDAPEDENQTLRVKYGYALDGETLKNLSVNVYQADVEHLMDNYSLRENNATLARVPSTSLTEGGTLKLDLQAAQWDWNLGLNVQNNQRQATRYTGDTADAVDSVNSYMWPEVEIAQSGLFIEAQRAFSADTALKVGLRYDHVAYSAGNAAADPAGGPKSPNELYALYYGAEAEDGSEDNVGALLRYETPLAANTQGFVGLSRSVRTADATERYQAANGSSPDKRWVGNPLLDPEVHHQLDAGFNYQQAAYQTRVSAFYDEVGDYILRDRAHAQEGISQADNATIYRNVDAKLYGLEWDVSWKINPYWRFMADAASVTATNTTDERAIAQTPPLNGSLRLAYAQDTWDAESAMRWASKQTRVDADPNTGSGLDAQETPGYVVLDISGTYRLASGVSLRAGVNNVFDHLYAEHLNRANQDPFNTDPVQVNEPGRTVWLKVKAIF